MSQRVQVLARLVHHEGEDCRASKVDDPLRVVHGVQVSVDEEARLELDVMEESDIDSKVEQTN